MFVASLIATALIIIPGPGEKWRPHHDDALRRPIPTPAAHERVTM